MPTNIGDEPIVPQVVQDDDFNELDQYLASHYLETLLNETLIIPEALSPLVKTWLQNLYAALKNPAATRVLKAPQVNVLNQYCNGLMAGKIHAVIPMATGTGKTFVFAHLLKFMMGNPDGSCAGKVLITTSTDNLVTQTIKEIKQVSPLVKIARWGEKAWLLADVVIATDQKLRMTNLDMTVEINNKSVAIKHLFNVLIADEGHCSLGEQGVKQIRTLIANGVLVIPVTATPVNKRKNLQVSGGLRTCYELIGTTQEENSILPFTIIAAEEACDIAPFRSAIITPELDEETKRVLRGLNNDADITEERLGRLINTLPLRRLAVHIYANLSDHLTHKRFLGQQFIFFCAGVNHAEDMAAELNSQIIIQDNRHLEQLREAYVQRVKERMRKEGGEFVEEDVRASFKVAKAIHAGEYSITLSTEQIFKALNANTLSYTNPRTLEKITRALTQDERQLLLTKQTLNHSATITVCPKLTLLERAKILEQYDEGGYLVLAGANMVSTGLNVKNIAGLIDLRATRSLSLYEQRLGRALRKNPNDPNKVAIIIDFNLGMTEQIFVYDIVNGKMALGRQDQPLVDEAHTPIIPISQQAAASPLVWGEEIILSVNNAAGKRTRHSSQPSSLGVPKEIQLETVMDGIVTIMSDIDPKLRVLEEQLNKFVGTVTTNAITRVAPKLPTFFARPAPQVALQQNSAQQNPQAPMTRLQESKLKKINRHAAEMVDRLKMIIESMEEFVNGDVIENEKSKRQKNDPEAVTNAPRVVVDDIKPVSTLATMQATLTQLKAMRTKLQRLTTDNICHSTLSLGDAISMTPREEKEEEIADLLAELQGVSDFIQASHQTLNLDKIQFELHQAKERKQAELKRKVTAPTVVTEKPSAPIVAVGSHQAMVDLTSQKPMAVANDKKQLGTTKRTFTTKRSEESIEELAIRSLFSSITMNRTNMVETMLKEHPDYVNAVRTQKESPACIMQFSPFLWCIHNHNILMATLLLDKFKANVLWTNISNKTALMYLAVCIASPFVLTLAQRVIDLGVPVNAQHKSSLDHLDTALHIAARNQNFDFCRFLLDKGADPTIRNRNEETFLDVIPVETHPLAKKAIVEYSKQKMVVEKQSTEHPQLDPSDVEMDAALAELANGLDESLPVATVSCVQTNNPLAVLSVETPLPFAREEPEKLALTYYQRALTALSKKGTSIESVIADLDLAIRFNPQLTDTWLLRAKAKFQANNYEGAAADYISAIRKRSDILLTTYACEMINQIIVRFSDLTILGVKNYSKEIDELRKVLQLTYAKNAKVAANTNQPPGEHTNPKMPIPKMARR